MSLPAAAGRTRAMSRAPTVRVATNEVRSTGCTFSRTGVDRATGVRASYGPGVRRRGRRSRNVPSGAARTAATPRPRAYSATGSPARAGTTRPRTSAGFP